MNMGRDPEMVDFRALSLCSLPRIWRVSGPTTLSMRNVLTEVADVFGHRLAFRLPSGVRAP